jgi:hypothetical protein
MILKVLAHGWNMTGQTAAVYGAKELLSVSVLSGAKISQTLCAASQDDEEAAARG